MTTVGREPGVDRSWSARIERHAAVAGALAALDDHRVRDLVGAAPVLGIGIGGTHRSVHVGGAPVFVKQVLLTDLERRPEHLRSTANLFDLPLGCHYGVGSPSFGAWRELAANLMTTGWVVAGRSEAFPLLHHWRVLDGGGPASAGPSGDELADVEGMVARWHGSAAVRRRVEAIAASTATVNLFVEHLPFDLPTWLAAQLAAGPEALAAAVDLVERDLRREVAAMNGAGLFHFDAHLGNILTDGHRLYLADLGLATSPGFDLAPAERRFLAANVSHDAAHTMTRLVDWLVTHVAGEADWRERDRRIARVAAGEPLGPVGPPAVAAVITRYAAVAAEVNELYRRLHLESRATPYPAAAVERACAAAGLTISWTADRA